MDEIAAVAAAKRIDACFQVALHYGSLKSTVGINIRKDNYDVHVLSEYRCFPVLTVD